MQPAALQELADECVVVRLILIVFRPRFLELQHRLRKFKGSVGESGPASCLALATLVDRSGHVPDDGTSTVRLDMSSKNQVSATQHDCQAVGVASDCPMNLCSAADGEVPMLWAKTTSQSFSLNLQHYELEMVRRLPGRASRFIPVSERVSDSPAVDSGCQVALSGVWYSSLLSLFFII